MAVVIRLQGLRVTAGSEDIRKFFTGLKIPDGGVHIIGGEREEAFIIFASDEDARRAMTRSGGCIRGTPVNLLLSSKAEMQAMLEESTKNAQLDQKGSLEENSRRLEMDVARGARRSGHPEAGRRSGSRSGHSPQHQRASLNCNDDLYVFLRGMPFSVVEKDVSDFFCGLLVDDIILLKNARGQNNGQGLVKFATSQDASEGLKRDKEYIGSRYVDVYTATEKQWHEAAGKVAMGVNNDDMFKRGRSPDRTQRNPQHRVRSRSPLAPRSSSPSNEEFCILLENLSFAVDKEHIKGLFHHARLEDDQILYILGSDGRRTRSAFVLFKNLKDYCAALTHHNEEFVNRRVCISPISREKMISILQSSQMNESSPGNSESFQERPPSHCGDTYDSEKLCLYVRNMPFDVRKVEVMDLFFRFNITEDKVILLHGNNDVGLGEALVLFRSEEEAVSAQSLNGRRFLGQEVMLKCISKSQMREFGIELPGVQEPLLREERHSSWSSQASYRRGGMEHPDMRIPHDGNMPVPNQQAHILGGNDYISYPAEPHASQDRGNGSGHGRFGSSVRHFDGPSEQHFDGPTCIKLVNLPFQIRSEEIYDFCYGYHIIPGSVSLQYDKTGAPKGSATVVFESRQEALTAIEELSGRPIGARKIQLVFV